MEKILIDTSALYALKNESDHFHLQSLEIYKNIMNSGEYILVITNFILCEFLNLANMRNKHSFAVDCLEFIEKSTIMEKEHISLEMEKEATKIFKREMGAKYSFTDCTSFAFMKANKLKKAFTFDKHFKEFGFEFEL